MADFPPFAFTTQESWYGELSFKAAEDGSPVSLAGRQFEMWITPASSGAQLVPPVLILTMEAGRGLSLKQGDPSTLVFRVPKTTANDFPRGEFTGDVLEVVNGERYLFMPVRITYAEPSGLRAFLTRFLGVSVAFASRQQPIYTPLAVPGREGRPGATILRGTVPPVPADGKDDDYYIEDRTASGQGRRMWGPKAAGAWPGTPWNIQVASYTDVPGLSGELGNRLRLDADQALSEPLRSRGRLNLGLGDAALLNATTAGRKAVEEGRADELAVRSALAGAITRTFAAIRGDQANVLDFGADPTAASGSTEAFRAAIATGRTVYVPKGRYRIDDELVLNRSQKMVGDGRTVSQLYVTFNTFNLAARGVVVSPTNTEPGAILEDFSIFFNQPDTNVRANIVAFPPGIYAQTSPRFQINRVRVSGGSYGLDARGNTGGAWVNNFECSALVKGMMWDGAKDGVHIHGYHFWNFDIPTTSQLYSVMSDNLVAAAELGRIDGLDASGWLLWRGHIDITANAAGAGFITNFLHNISLDGDFANLRIAGGEWNLSNVYLTKSPAVADTIVSVTGGNVSVSNMNIYSSASATAVQVTGGALYWHGGKLSSTAPTVPAATVSNAMLSLSNVQLQPAAGSWTAPFISQLSGGVLRANGNRMAAPTVGTPVAFSYVADNASNLFSGNTLNGWAVVLPNLAQLGNYGSTYQSTARRTLNGTAYTVPNSRMGSLTQRFVQTAAVASQTLTLENPGVDGYYIQFVNYAGPITALTFSPPVNGWTNGSALGAYASVRVRWDATAAAWYRE